eukprot:TRINITY_DN2007_c0_g1_i1.p1 TRINITY_DN2007_c0_g1~~TRINITY_DN2007_c0_g1_i1.p1  ORF type:complete len:961 (-),score=160.52 TRINITY_DN2007_c0_g1_i1:1489-4371(-)
MGARSHCRRTINGILDVHVHYASGLQLVNAYGEQDVFCRFLFGEPDVLESAILQTKTVRKGGSRPTFDQTLQIGVPDEEQFLTCEIFAPQPRGRDKLLGKATVDVQAVKATKRRKAVDYQLSSSHMEASAGTITLTLAYHSRKPGGVCRTSSGSSVAKSSMDAGGLGSPPLSLLSGRRKCVAEAGEVPQGLQGPHRGEGHSLVSNSQNGRQLNVQREKQQKATAGGSLSCLQESVFGSVRSQKLGADFTDGDPRLPWSTFLDHHTKSDVEGPSGLDVEVLCEQSGGFSAGSDTGGEGFKGETDSAVRVPVWRATARRVASPNGGWPPGTDGSFWGNGHSKVLPILDESSGVEEEQAGVDTVRKSRVLQLLPDIKCREAAVKVTNADEKPPTNSRSWSAYIGLPLKTEGESESAPSAFKRYVPLAKAEGFLKRQRPSSAAEGSYIALAHSSGHSSGLLSGHSSGHLSGQAGTDPLIGICSQETSLGVPSLSESMDSRRPSGLVQLHNFSSILQPSQWMDGGAEKGTSDSMMAPKESDGCPLEEEEASRAGGQGSAGGLGREVGNALETSRGWGGMLEERRPAADLCEMQTECSSWHTAGAAALEGSGHNGAESPFNTLPTGQPISFLDRLCGGEDRAQLRHVPLDSAISPFNNDNGSSAINSAASSSRWSDAVEEAAMMTMPKQQNKQGTVPGSVESNLSNLSSYITRTMHSLVREPPSPSSSIGDGDRLGSHWSQLSECPPPSPNDSRRRQFFTPLLSSPCQVAFSGNQAELTGSLEAERIQHQKTAAVLWGSSQALLQQQEEEEQQQARSGGAALSAQVRVCQETAALWQATMGKSVEQAEVVWREAIGKGPGGEQAVEELRQLWAQRPVIGGLQPPPVGAMPSEAPAGCGEVGVRSLAAVDASDDANEFDPDGDAAAATARGCMWKAFWAGQEAQRKAAAAAVVAAGGNVRYGCRAFF